MLEGFCDPSPPRIASLRNRNYGRSWPRCRLKYILSKLNPDSFASIIGIDAPVEPRASLLPDPKEEVQFDSTCKISPAAGRPFPRYTAAPDLAGSPETAEGLRRLEPRVTFMIADGLGIRHYRNRMLGF